MNHGEVKTIPAIIGIQKTKQLGYLTIFAAYGLAVANYFLTVYATPVIIGLSLSYLSSAWLISSSSEERHDYFYSGLMDGTMIFQFLFVWFFYSFF